MSAKTNNRKTLDDLFNSNKIDIRRGEIFDTPLNPVPDALDFNRVEGMMLGLAIGDALGITTETMLPEERRAYHGEIRDYLPNRYMSKPIGYPSDDTQLAFWTLEQMTYDGGFVPQHVANRFCKNNIHGIGFSVREFLLNFKSGKK